MATTCSKNQSHHLHICVSEGIRQSAIICNNTYRQDQCSDAMFKRGEILHVSRECVRFGCFGYRSHLSASSLGLVHFDLFTTAPLFIPSTPSIIAILLLRVVCASPEKPSLLFCSPRQPTVFLHPTTKCKVKQTHPIPARSSDLRSIETSDYPNSPSYHLFPGRRRSRARIQADHPS